MLRFLSCIWIGTAALSFQATAQPLTAFVNMQNQLNVWDKGAIRKIDYLPPVALKIGRTAIPYLDNARNFKIYYGGGVRNVNIGFTNDFWVTDNLVAFRNARSLNVFDKGVTKNLSGLCDQYYIGDSLVLFLDGVRQEFKAYYDGSVYPVENFLADTAIYKAKVSDNIAAYDNYANQFRLFYQGNTIAQENYTVSSFDVGRNTAAYIDINRRFKIFHSGNTIVADEFPPDDYAVGDNVVAFVSNDGYFKIFYDDSVRTIGFFRPEFTVRDNIVAYRDAGGYFRVFYKGDITTLETYYPERFSAQYNSVAYINQGSVLRVFTEGELYDVTSIFNYGDNSTDNWELSYDVIRYRVGPNTFRVFYKGQDYH